MPASRRISQDRSGAMRARARVRRQRGAPFSAQPGAGAKCQRELDARRAAAVRGQQQRERRPMRRTRLRRQLQPAHRGQGRGLGQLGHHQRHQPAAQRLLDRPEDLDRGARPAEDQPPGIEKRPNPVAHQPLRRPGRLQPEHRPGQPRRHHERERGPRRPCHLVRPASARPTPGASTSISAAGVRRVWSMAGVRAMFSRARRGDRRGVALAANARVRIPGAVRRRSGSRYTRPGRGRRTMRSWLPPKPRARGPPSG